MSAIKEGKRMVSASVWQMECESAVLAAKAAGKTLLEWSGKVTVQRKGRNDLVTEADHAAQDTIRRALTRRFPADEFLGEEGAGAAQPPGGRRWLVDPLDGTTNYVHGLPFFCVSIGLEVAGKPTVGVVYDPIRNECFSAVAGGGARCNGVTLRVSNTPSLADALVGVGLPADVHAWPHAVSAFVNMTKRSRSVRRLGSAALSLAYVSAGRIDAFWAHDLRPWDAAAGCLLILEAGGRVTNLDQTPYNLYTPDIAATNGLIHAELSAETTPAQPRDG
jgi:myo-inositol-1(or 4)-monophosphatase